MFPTPGYPPISDAEREERNKERWEQYVICKQRGHESSGHMATSNPPWNICKHCGTYYREEMVTRELQAPLDPNRDEMGG